MRSITSASPAPEPANVKIAGRRTGAVRSSAAAASKSRHVSKARRSKCAGGIARDLATRCRAASQPTARPQPGNGRGGWLIAAANRPAATPVSTLAKPGQVALR